MRHFLLQMQALMNHLEILTSFDCVPHIDVTVEPMFKRPANIMEATLRVPAPFVKDGRIAFNISVSAVQNFFADFENGVISFNARFHGVSQNIVVPMEHINTMRNKAGAGVFGFDYTKMAEKEFWSVVQNPFYVEKEVEEVKEEKPANRPGLRLV